MAIVWYSILSLVLGLGVVSFTSPTVSSIAAGTSFFSLSALQFHALAVDGVFVVLVSFLILCNVESRWIARNQSFPFSYRPSWNVGPRSFDFQLLTFEIFHIRKFARAVHVVFLVLEELLWLAVVHGTFGYLGLLTVNVLLVGQSLSYLDAPLAFSILCINTAFSGITWCFIEFPSQPYMSGSDNLNLAKVALFWAVFFRTASHVDEPVPPSYDEASGLFYPGFGESGYEHVARAPLHSFWLLVLGTVSELGAGVPGRLFNVVVYKAMWRLGYRSQVLCAVTEAKEDARLVHQKGWAINKTIREMFSEDVEAWDVEEKYMDMLLEG